MWSCRQSCSTQTNGISKRCSPSDRVVKRRRARRRKASLRPVTERSLLAWTIAMRVRPRRRGHLFRGQYAPTLSPGTCRRGSRRTLASFSPSAISPSKQRATAASRGARVGSSYSVRPVYMRSNRADDPHAKARSQPQLRRRFLRYQTETCRKRVIRATARATLQTLPATCSDIGEQHA